MDQDWYNTEEKIAQFLRHAMISTAHKSGVNIEGVQLSVTHKVATESGIRIDKVTVDYSGSHFNVLLYSNNVSHGIDVVLGELRILEKFHQKKIKSIPDNYGAW